MEVANQIFPPVAGADDGNFYCLDAITGKLVHAMRDAMADPQAPDWTTRYSIREDPPLNVPGRHGKSRPRVDIEFERVQHGHHRHVRPDTGSRNAEPGL